MSSTQQLTALGVDDDDVGGEKTAVSPPTSSGTTRYYGAADDDGGGDGPTTKKKFRRPRADGRSPASGPACGVDVLAKTDATTMTTSVDKRPGAADGKDAAACDSAAAGAADVIDARNRRTVIAGDDDAEKPSIFGVRYYATREHFVFWKFEINRALLPLKLIMFCFYGAMAALLPYVTIHMQTLGISIEEIAIIYAVLPFTSFLGPPITGFIADKCGNYKTVLSLSILTTAAFHTLLLFVPPYFDAAEVPVTFKFHCLTEYSYFSVPGAETNPHKQCRYPQLPASLSVANCSYHCPEGRSAKICGPSGDCLPQGDLRAIFPSNSALPPLVPNASNTLTLSLMPGLGAGLFRRLDEIVLEGVQCICPMTCSVAERSEQSCPQVGNGAVTFWTYFVLRIVATLFMGAAFSLLDATALSIVTKQGKEYGKQRVWAILAMAILSPITGVMVDVISQAKGYTDYSSAFYVSDVMSLLNIVLGFFLAFDVEPAKEDLLENMGKILRLVEADVFLFMMFILGCIWGFVESYLFIYLKELGSPNYLLGMTLTIGSVVGIPFLYGAEGITNKIGRANVIILAFFVYFARCFGYSYIPSPWWCFPFEAMEAFTYHLMWVAAATYVTVLAPPGLLATMTGIMGAVHFSVGKGAGSFAGGYLIAATGMRNSFRYTGIFAAVVGVIYLAVQHLYLKQKIEDKLRKDEAKKEQKEREAHTNEAIIIDDAGFGRVARSASVEDDSKNVYGGGGDGDDDVSSACSVFAADSGVHTVSGSPDGSGLVVGSADQPMPNYKPRATADGDPVAVVVDANVVRKRGESSALGSSSHHQ